MVEQIDIYRAANMLIKKRGKDAAIEAAGRADEMLAKGDIEGERVWLSVLKAVNELQSIQRGDAPLN